LIYLNAREVGRNRLRLANTSLHLRNGPKYGLTETRRCALSNGAILTGRPKGDSRPGFRPPNLPAFAWRATGDISAQLKCFPSGHSWKRQDPFKDKPHDDNDNAIVMSLMLHTAIN